MSALLVLAAGLLLAWAGWAWSMRSVDGATRVAIVAVLGVTAAAFNVVVPVPSIEATTTVVLCSAIVLGARTATAVGLVAIVVSSVTGGLGAWTAWQVVAALLVAAIGALAGTLRRDADWFARPQLVLLALVSILATAAWDVVTTAGSVLSYVPAGGSPLPVIGSALLVGAAFTAVHVVCSTAFTLLGGPPLLHALQRARPRLDGGLVLARQ